MLVDTPPPPVLFSLILLLGRLFGSFALLPLFLNAGWNQLGHAASIGRRQAVVKARASAGAKLVLRGVDGGPNAVAVAAVVID